MDLNIPNLIIEEPDVTAVTAGGARQAVCEHCGHVAWVPPGFPLGPTAHSCWRDEQACYVVWGRLVGL